MMGVGNSFRKGFEMLVRQMGDNVVIFRNHGTPTETQQRVRGLKNTKTKRGGGDVFQFLDKLDIRPDDIIQIEGARDLWRVTDCHDDVINGTFQHFEVDVVRHLSAGGFAPPSRPSFANTVNVHGNVTGALQVGTQHRYAAGLPRSQPAGWEVD